MSSREKPWREKCQTRWSSVRDLPPGGETEGEMVAGGARRRGRLSCGGAGDFSPSLTLGGCRKTIVLSMWRVTSKRYWTAPRVLVAFRKRCQVFGTGLFGLPTYWAFRYWQGPSGTRPVGALLARFPTVACLFEVCHAVVGMTVSRAVARSEDGVRGRWWL